MLFKLIAQLIAFKLAFAKIQNGLKDEETLNSSGSSTYITTISNGTENNGNDDEGLTISTKVVGNGVIFGPADVLEINYTCICHSVGPTPVIIALRSCWHHIETPC